MEHDAIIQELYHDLWKKRCQNTGINKWIYQCFNCGKSKVRKKEKKVKAMNITYRIMDDIKKQLEIVFSEDTSNSTTKSWKQQTERSNEEIQLRNMLKW